MREVKQIMGEFDAAYFARTGEHLNAETRSVLTLVAYAARGTSTDEDIDAITDAVGVMNLLDGVDRDTLSWAGVYLGRSDSLEDAAAQMDAADWETVEEFRANWDVTDTDDPVDGLVDMVDLIIGV